jgi:hypothetical protein
MSADADAPRALDRRAFLHLTAAALAAQALGPVTAAAQAAPPAGGAAPPPPAAPAATPAPSADAVALTEQLRRRYPERFSDAQWASITRDFEFDLGAGRRLRAAALANGDEPDFAFRV